MEQSLQLLASGVTELNLGGKDSASDWDLFLGLFILGERG
jgi:hypothetical protein